MEKACFYCTSRQQLRALTMWYNPEQVYYYCREHYAMVHRVNEEKKAEFIEYYSNEERRKRLSEERLKLYYQLTEKD